MRAGDVVLATARATLVWVGPDLASVAIPEHARAAIAAFEGQASG